MITVRWSRKDPPPPPPPPLWGSLMANKKAKTLLEGGDTGDDDGDDDDAGLEGLLGGYLIFDECGYQFICYGGGLITSSSTTPMEYSF